MPSKVQQLFDDGALTYDEGRRKIIPCFDAFYGALLALVPFAPGDRFRFLDLGAGTGLASALILAEFPRAQADILDFSEKMLERARRRFAGSDRVRFLVRDYGREPLPGRYPLVVSAMSIHHQDDLGKWMVMRSIFNALDSFGWFIHADLALGSTSAMEALYQRRWREHLDSLGLPAEELTAIRARMACDKPAPLEQQLSKMRQAGFVDVDCIFKHYNFAVYAGRKP